MANVLESKDGVIMYVCGNNVHVCVVTVVHIGEALCVILEVEPAS